MNLNYLHILVVILVIGGGYLMFFRPGPAFPATLNYKWLVIGFFLVMIGGCVFLIIADNTGLLLP